MVRYFLARREQVPGLPRASESALNIMMSRWENGHVEVTEPGYQRLFREIYGRTNEELGFPPEPASESAEELRNRLLVSRTVDAATLDLFQRQVNDLRGADKQFGSLPVLDQLSAHIRQLEAIRSYSVNPTHRERLSHILTDARTLAGWNALDRGSQLQAWQLHEDAKVSAREANAPHLLAHAAAQQAVILQDMGEHSAAVELLEFARYVADAQAPALLRTWLAAAHGEGLAAVGNRTAALQAFDDANRLMPTDPVDPSLPFLLLDDGHLTRWRGNTLLKLGDEDAINQLETAAKLLESSPTAAIRGQTGMYVDLAIAYAVAGDREKALAYIRKGRQLAARIDSDRQRKRLEYIDLSPDITGG
ncbi:tetratricopeptide repeat protein [Actinokineospora sp. PR83]|uniref:tetratricopeptide repeat protein n=1 Tax=Actinokineospora sp. PR83 TaxID=2884908 RepID=UPI0027DF5626|nr:tetratricopeptide repeat protein [Actinokineospora sp. PR83]MCG8918780.1 tetratricopeptide repeat protein [Actinokineospora sp. PR83]